MSQKMSSSTTPPATSATVVAAVMDAPRWEGSERTASRLPRNMLCSTAATVKRISAATRRLPRQHETDQQASEEQEHRAVGDENAQRYRLEEHEGERIGAAEERP